MKPSPYDPHHVTLNLIQELHSRIMSQEAAVDTERELRREETKRTSDALLEAGQLRDELERQKKDFLISKDILRSQAGAYRSTLELIAKMRGKGGETARSVLFCGAQVDNK